MSLSGVLDEDSCGLDQTEHYVDCVGKGLLGTESLAYRTMQAQCTGFTMLH